MSSRFREPEMPPVKPVVSESRHPTSLRFIAWAMIIAVAVIVVVTMTR